MIEFLTGSLPWKGKEKTKIGQLKLELTNPDLVRHLPSPISDFYHHLTSLDYFSVPDYNFLISLLDRLYQISGAEIGRPFDWDYVNTLEMQSKFIESSQSSKSILAPIKSAKDMSNNNMEITLADSYKSILPWIYNPKYDKVTQAASRKTGRNTGIQV